ncbi:MAG: methylenetetrahydrofolate reductase C-terminal domain-containing protein [Candidatus Brachytrichaceae bacterium NZ_4S206]|jgi:methylenetetrahydrofolate reductase (NADPH)
MALTLEEARARCPKRMWNGPCGGVRDDGTCEVGPHILCPYPRILDQLPWRLAQGACKRDAASLASHIPGRLARKLAAGEFVILAELWPPADADLSQTIARYQALGPQVDAVNVADSPLAQPFMSSLAACAAFRHAGMEAIMNLSCKDRSRIALQAELMGAGALGINAVLCITGDHPALGDHRAAQPVYDLDSFGLIRLARRLRDDGQFDSGRAVASRPGYLIGAAGSPFTQPVEIQAERAAAKIFAGADFIATQAVFDPVRFTAFARQMADFGALACGRLIAGMAVVTTLEQAHWLNSNVPGARVSPTFTDTLTRELPDRRRATALRWNAEFIAHLRQVAGVSGVLLYAMEHDVESLGELLAMGF